jgi:VanZ family protein
MKGMPITGAVQERTTDNQARMPYHGQNTIVRFHLIWFRFTQSKWRPSLALALLLLWGLFIIYATMLPFDFSASGDLIVKRLWRLWEHPLKGGSWADVTSNVLLFIPWGLVLGVWLAGRGTSYLASLALAVSSAALLSGSVELLQLFAPHRIASFVDLVTNTFGSTVGALAGWPWAKWQWPILSVRIRQLLASGPVTGCALGTAAVFMLAGLAPFDASLSVSNLKAALKAARPIPFGPPLAGSATPKHWFWACEFLSWTLAGGLVALAAREWGRQGATAVGWSVVLVGGLCLAIEAVQLAIPARDFDMTSVALAAFGSAAGAAAVTRTTGGEARRWIVPALAIWGLAVALSAWSPPHFTWPEPPLWRTERVVPFWSYFHSRSLADLADVTWQAMYFVPLGALLAARSWRQSFLVTVLVGLAIGTMLEIGQVFLPHRTADISDALSAGAGASVGWALWRWGEWARTSSMGVARYRVGPRAGLKR